jgi:hypothetical protein
MASSYGKRVHCVEKSAFVSRTSNQKPGSKGVSIMTAEKTSRFRFFLPDARLLENDEIAKLPPEKLKTVEAGGRKGLWLEIVCPQESCIDDKGNITIPAKGVDASEEKGFFLNLFCPEDSCEVVESTDLP